MKTLDESGMECRFTGGPLRWRRLLVMDHVNELRVPAPSRPVTLDFETRREFLADMAKGPIMALTGTYRRIAPDRFRWMGWDGQDDDDKALDRLAEAYTRP